MTRPPLAAAGPRHLSAHGRTCALSGHAACLSCALCREEHGGGGLTVPLRIGEPGRYNVRMGFLNESVPPQTRVVHVAAEVVMGLSYGHDASAAIAADGELLLVLQVGLVSYGC